MINARYIRLVSLLVVAFVTLLTTECRAAVVSDDFNRPAATATDNGAVIVEHCPNAVAIATNSSTPQSVTPSIRTIHNVVRSAERALHNTKAINAIDATTLAHRYGLYNHKILFVSVARHHYVCRLRRLII